MTAVCQEIFGMKKDIGSFCGINSITFLTFVNTEAVHYNHSIWFFAHYIFLTFSIFRHKTTSLKGMQKHSCNDIKSLPGGCVFQNFLFRSVYDNSEIVGLKACTADETTVDVGLCKKLCRIACVHASAVLNTDSIRNLSTVKTLDCFTDDSANFISLVCCSSFTCSDCPYRFVCYNNILCILS